MQLICVRRSLLARERDAIIRKPADLLTSFSGRIWSQGACSERGGAVPASVFSAYPPYVFFNLPGSDLFFLFLFALLAHFGFPL